MKTIEEKNRMIAEFMGIESYQFRNYTMFVFDDDNHRTDIDLHYHSSWDWLMPVVDAIYNTGMDEQTTNETGDVTYALLDVDINSLHDAVVKFIEFYNENK